MLLFLVCVISAIIICPAKHVDIEDIPYDVEEGFKQIFQEEIKGPKSFDDNIAIVGAGPSGIHMAYLLKEKGYRNVHIYEKTDRLGGKSLSINHRGAIHEMGTVYISPDYETNVLKLLRKFTNTTLTSPPIPMITGQNLTDRMPFGVYIFQRLRVKYPNKTTLQLKEHLLERLNAYTNLHYTLFGNYQGVLMSEPSESTKKLINGTFYDFLHRHRLLDLIDFFIASFTIQGYGKLNDVPALYVLMWNTPKLMNALWKVFDGEKKKDVYMLSTGFEHFWKTMVRKANINITYNADIRYIYTDSKSHDYYGKKEKIFLYYGIHESGETIIKSYDFLVWTPSPKMLLTLVGGKTFSEEKGLFGSLENAYYTTSLVDSIGELRSKSPIDWFYYNINNEEDLNVWASRDSYSALHDIHGQAYETKLTTTGNDGETAKRSSVYYQYSKTTPVHKVLRDKLEAHMNRLQASYVRVLQQHTWPYFERFSVQETEAGYHWRVLRNQGKHNIWFTGASVCFESVNSVMEYNELLVTLMGDSN